MAFTHPAAKIIAGVALGALCGLVAFESVRVTPPPSSPAYVPPATTAVVVVPETATGSVAGAAVDLPISAPGAPFLAPAAPRRRPSLLTGQKSFACGSQAGAPTVDVGWAVAALSRHPPARSRVPGYARDYSAAVAWEGEGVSLAVSCTPRAVPAGSGVKIAQATSAYSRPMVPLDYPTQESPSSGGLQVSGLFKPVTDALP